MSDCGKNLVAKSNSLIQASYRLTLGEHRLILMAIVEARRINVALDDEIEMAAMDYAEMFNVAQNQAYTEICDSARQIFRRYLVLYENRGWMREVRWISSAMYHDGLGRVRIRFTREVLPLIVELENRFTTYKLEAVASMTSTHAIRMYELLAQWRDQGWREVKIDWLRTALGIEDHEYPRLYDFKKWVIDVAVSQINEFSDLTASYEQRKTGRNVTHFKFTFALKEEPKPQQAQPQDVAADVRESALFQRLRGLGIGAKLAADWIKRDEARALASADYVEAKAKAGQVKGSTAGYLRTVFESGAELGPSAFEAEQKAKAKRQEEAGKRRQEQAKAEAREKAAAAVRALTPEERAAYGREWLASGKAGPGAAWDENRNDFKAATDRIGFGLWLQNRAGDGSAVKKYVERL